MPYPSSRTRLVILLGNPLGHSLSPAMHNHAFQVLGLDYLYLPAEVTAGNLATVFNGLKHMNVAGCNVTIPHKIQIMELLDEIDPLAEMIGAVNTICISHGRTRGYNTDGQGFLTHLEKQLSTTIKDKRIFILGSGGAARGVAMTMAFKDASKLYLCNRTAGKAAALADEINHKVKKCAEVIPASPPAMRKAIANCHILVNATSVGMSPHDDKMPFDPQILHPDLTVADLVYVPLETQLLAAAKKLGCSTVNGLGMLIYQGALGFKLWTGVEAPVEEMFKAVELKDQIQRE